MWSVASRVGGCGRGGGWFVVLWRPVRGTASVIRASRVAPLRLRAVECCFAAVIRASQVAPLRLWVVECCFVAVIRASQVAPLRLRAVECGFASVIRASQVAPLRLRVVECCFAAVIRASQVAPLRLRAVDCCFAAVIRASQVAPLRLRVVECCFAGGCWRRNEGLSGKGDGYEKKKPDRRCCVCLASCGCGGSTRTNDLQVMSLASYQLLHSAMCSLIRVQK